MSAVVEVLADERKDAGGAAYRDAGVFAILYDHEARFTVVVKRIRLVRGLPG